MTQTPPISDGGFRADWSGLRNLLDSSIATIEKQTTFEMRSAHLDELARVLESGIASALNAAASIPVSRGAETEVAPVAWLWECIDGPYKGEIDVHSQTGIDDAEAKRVAHIYGPPFAVYRALAAPQPVEEQEEIERLRTGLEKISAIRDSIIGFQNVGWSEHIYPLVAALHDAGFDGIGYDKARENVSTLLDLTKAAQARVEGLEGALNAMPDRADQPNAEAFAEAVDDWWKETAMPALNPEVSP